MKKLPKLLFKPQLPFNLSPKAKWLAGEGAGSWFVLEETEYDLLYEAFRYSPEGGFECHGKFVASAKIMTKESFEFDFPSNCAKLTVIQGGNRIILKNIKNKSTN